MRDIKYIAVHCTATQPKASIAAILRYWKDNLGWKSPGYHYIIDVYGNITNLQPEEKLSNGVKGYNQISVNVSYIGGVDEKNKAKDTRTDEQKASLLKILKELKTKYPNAKIQGHRDFPGVNKACPSFDAKSEYAGL